MTTELFGNRFLEFGGSDGGGIVCCGLATSCLCVGVLHKIGHGMVGHEWVGPAHEGDALALEFLIGSPDISLFHAGEQASLCRAEYGCHLFLDRMLHVKSLTRYA